MSTVTDVDNTKVHWFLHPVLQSSYLWKTAGIPDFLEWVSSTWTGQLPSWNYHQKTSCGISFISHFPPWLVLAKHLTTLHFEHLQQNDIQKWQVIYPTERMLLLSSVMNSSGCGLVYFHSKIIVDAHWSYEVERRLIWIWILWGWKPNGNPTQIRPSYIGQLLTEVWNWQDNIRSAERCGKSVLTCS